MEEPYRDEKPGDAAEEGTLAHLLADTFIKYRLKRISKLDMDVIVKGVEAHRLYMPAMRKHVDDYVAYIFEQYNTALVHTNDAQLITEEKTDLRAYVPDGDGTVDVKIIADTTLRIIDLKFGKGVPVSAVENKQLMLYALGSYLEYNFMYDIQNVHMTIYQPRLDSVTNYIIPVADLLEWAESVVKPRAKLAFKGQGDFVAGDHCNFCKVKGTCRAVAEYNLELAKFEFAAAHQLTDLEISDILSRAEQFKSWLKGVEDQALHDAVNKGRKVPGYKVVMGKSNRKYSSEDKVAAALLSIGYTESDIYKPKALLGLQDLEGKTGKDEFAKFVAPLLIKPQGQPTLAPLTDERPEYSTKGAAQADFANVDLSEHLAAEQVKTIRQKSKKDTDVSNLF